MILLGGFCWQWCRHLPNVFLQILGGQVDPPIEFIPLYDILASLVISAPKLSEKVKSVKLSSSNSSASLSAADSAATPKAKKGVLGKLTRAFSSKIDRN